MILLTGLEYDVAPPETLVEPKEPDPHATKAPEIRPHIVHPLSDIVKDIFKSHNGDIDFSNRSSLSATLKAILDNAEVLSEPQYRFVGKFGPQIVVKVIRSNSDLTEYTTLQYLATHKPHLPIPRPHGVIVLDSWAYLFQTLMPGVRLTEIWPLLEPAQKQSVSVELDYILSDLRRIEKPANTPLGGVSGEGCKDGRRHVRVSPRPLYTAKEFWNFQYSDPHVGSSVYLESLRRITTSFQSSKCVFTHGDIRMHNILVRQQDDQSYSISGLIDWAMSGFYPEDFECTKITNNLTSNEKSDWYLYLPQCVSPEKFPSRWLADSAWDPLVV